jgi:integrase
MDTYVQFHARVVRLVDTESTRSFCRRNALRDPPDGFPILISEAGTVIEPVLAYLQTRFVVNKLINRPQSLRGADNTHFACANDLLHFLNFLDVERLPIARLTTEAINSYIDSLQDVCVVSGEPYKPSTARRRSSTAIGFVEWLQKEGRLSERLEIGQLGVSRRGNDSGERSRPRVAGGGTSHLTFNILKRREATSLLELLGPLPSETATNVSRCRDRLAVQAALMAGLRRSELTSLIASEIEQCAGDVRADRPLDPFFFTVVGKGDKERVIELPSWFVSELLIYVNQERMMAVRSGREMYGDSYVEPKSLFINGPKVPTRRGLATDAGTIYRSYRIAQKKLLELGHVKRTFRLHDLRHTFAVWKWLSLKRAGETQPAKIVQCLLGHESPETTEKVYLGTVALFEPVLFEGVYERFKRGI